MKDNNQDISDFVNMELHQGEGLEKAIRASGMSISYIAREMGRSRRHFYNIFEQEKVEMRP
ncbi:MAG: hypothetical protein AB8B61_09670 [Cyclobacteriaceae bacterium]